VSRFLSVCRWGGIREGAADGLVAQLRLTGVDRRPCRVSMGGSDIRMAQLLLHHQRTDPFPEALRGSWRPSPQEGEINVRELAGWLHSALGIIWGIPYSSSNWRFRKSRPCRGVGRIVLATLILLPIAWRVARSAPSRSQGSSLRLRNGRVRNHFRRSRSVSVGLIPR